MYETVKRTIDVVVAVVLLVVTIPIWIPIAIAIRFGSPGPVLYHAPRIGKDGLPFTMYKFRTMRADAARLGPAITLGEDPRVTPIGRRLRKWKIDELPQLINVVRGQMSLVGPRPEAPEYVALYNTQQRRVLSVPPGVTGPSQVIHRHEERLLDREDAEEYYRQEILPKKLEIDLDYVQHRSLLLDLRVIVQTIASLWQH